MGDGQVTLERRGPVAVVTLDRPDKRNALGPSLWSGLRRVADELHDALPRAVVITGAGDAFCAGMDVNPQNPQVAALIEAVQSGDKNATHSPRGTSPKSSPRRTSYVF